MYEQHHLRYSSINFAIQKINLGSLTAGTAKNILKEQLKVMMWEELQSVEQL